MKTFPEITKKITKEGAYLLGLLWTDGYLRHKPDKDRKKRCLYRISLEILKSDFDHISSLFIKWWIGSRSRKDKKDIGLAVIHNKELYSFLQQNLYESKSIDSFTKLLSQMSPKVYKYFLRGYFDGDGCLWLSKTQKRCQLKFCGSYEQDWSGLFQLLSYLKIDSYKHNLVIAKKGKSSNIRICRAKDIEKLLSFVYDDYDKLGFPRKYQKYQEFRAKFM